MSARHQAVVGEAELIARHRDLAVNIAGDYFIPGADSDDVVQEAMIGLLVAARTYDGRGPFRTFAALVVRCWLQTEVTRARRAKRALLTEAARVGRDEHGEELPLVAFVEDCRADVVALVEQRAQIARYVEATKKLTPLEREWLTVVVNGGEYSSLVGGRDKRAENAVERARRKLRKAA